jgi:2'-5' RNA ligase
MSEKILCVMAGFDDITEKHLFKMQSNLYEKGFIGTQTKDLPQHITLGVFPVEKENELIDLVTQVSKEFKPFDIAFNHIGIFGGSRVLFIAPDPNAQLLGLKENFGESFNWTPHTTMLIDESETIYKALPVVADNFEAFQGQVQEIHLFEFWPTRHILSLKFPG